MELGNERIARLDRPQSPGSTPFVGAAGPAEDRVVAVQQRSTTPHRLTMDQRAVLRALAAHLMPVDDFSSVHADVAVRYIEYLIAHETVTPDLPLPLGEIYRTGCSLVQAHACHAYGRRVQAMDAIERDKLVWDMLESSMDGFDRFSPAYFFHTLRRHIADAMQSELIAPN